jgi:serine phosphatase RsbU (regulator of sigma subunit)
VVWALGVGLAVVVAVAAFTTYFRRGGSLLVSQGPLALHPSLVDELQFFFDVGFIGDAQTLIHVTGWSVFAVVGFGLLVRGGDDWLRLLTSLMLVVTGVALFSPSSLLQETGSAWHGWAEAVGVLVPGPVLWRSVAGVALLAFALVFPDGRPGPRWAVVAAGAFVAHVVVWAVVPFDAVDPRTWPEALSVGWTLLPIVVALGAQFQRYLMVSSAETRTRTRLVVLALALSSGTFVLLWAVRPELGSGVFDLVVTTPRLQALYDLNGLVLLTVALLLLPFAISISVLRHGLWNLDLLVSRTVAYGSLTAIVAGVFFVGLVGVGSLLAQFVGGGRGIAGVATGVVVVALFQPVRRRVQSAVDRRFYREKYDAEQVIEGFAASIVDVVDLDDVEAGLLDAIDGTLHPDRASLWRPDRDDPLPQEAVEVLASRFNRPIPGAEVPHGGVLGDARSVLPLAAQEDLVGVVSLGARRAGGELTSVDAALLSRLAHVAAPALRLALVVRLRAAEAEERARMESEMEVARTIQIGLLPHELPSLPGWAFDARYRAARQVGGDYYDVLDLGSGRIGLLVADVSGKGIPAAMVMTTTRTVFHAEASADRGPAATLEAVNRRLAPDLTPGLFVTCFYAVLDVGDGRLSFANAGNPLPILCRTGGEAGELVASGSPLGWFPDSTYESAGVTLGEGDLVLLHSDAVIEARAPDGSLFGRDRLLDLMQHVTGIGGLLDLVDAAVQAHSGPGAEPEDDLTLLAVHRKGPAS